MTALYIDRKDISIHALREEGDFRLGIMFAGLQAISIHALREEGDHFFPPSTLALAISIHALREEGDPSSKSSFRRRQHFNPRPP